MSFIASPRHDLSGTTIGLPIDRPGVVEVRVCLGRQSVLAVPDRSCLGKSFLLIIMGQRGCHGPGKPDHEIRRPNKEEHPSASMIISTWILSGKPILQPPIKLLQRVVLSTQPTSPKTRRRLQRRLYVPPQDARCVLRPDAGCLAPVCKRSPSSVGGGPGCTDPSSLPQVEVIQSPMTPHHHMKLEISIN